MHTVTTTLGTLEISCRQLWRKDITKGWVLYLLRFAVLGTEPGSLCLPGPTTESH